MRVDFSVYMGSGWEQNKNKSEILLIITLCLKQAPDFLQGINRNCLCAYTYITV